MNPKIASISYLAIFFLAIGSIEGEPGFFAPPKQCENPNVEIAEQCLNEFCQSQSDVFVCQALDCKKNGVGEGLLQQFAKLKCIQNVCTSNPLEIVCVKLEECGEKKRTLGLFPFIECVIELFAED